MNKGPGLFSDLGKKARDLLTKDYLCSTKFSISTSTHYGLDIASSIEKKGSLFSGDVAAQYKHNNALVDVKVDTDSNILTTLTITDVPQSTKAIASLKFPDYNSAKLEAQYFCKYAAFTTAVGLKQSPDFDFSATVGTPSIAFGAEGSYVTGSSEFAKYNFGVCLTKPNFNASVILADKRDSLRVSYLHHLGKLKGGAVVGEISRKYSTNIQTLTVGCSYMINSQTMIKVKLNNHGNLGALIQHDCLREYSQSWFGTLSRAFNVYI